jgi:hypothetical protein
MNRERIFVVATSFFLSLLELKIKLEGTPTFFDGTLVSIHEKLLAFTYTNNEQSRLLQFYVPELIHRVSGASVPGAYAFQRFAFVWAAFVAFHFFLRRWFRPLEAFAGLALLAALLPMTFLNDLQEGSSLLLLTFTLAMWAIREEKGLWFAAALWVGALNNETILVLSATYLFVTRDVIRTALLSAPAWISVAIIRYITRDQPHLGGANHLMENLRGIGSALRDSPWQWYMNWYLGAFFLFGALWYFAFAAFREKPPFLRRASLTIPLFLAAHLITGVIIEIRQMIPLVTLLIPMAFFYLRPPNEETAGSAV